MPNTTLSTHTLSTRHRSELIDITSLVATAVADADISSGIAIVFVPHTTAAVTINENADPDVQHDLLRKLESLIPQREPYYQHNEGNSDAHLKASLLGQSATILIQNAHLVLGTWQAIYFAEFDGPRQRQLHIKIHPD